MTENILKIALIQDQPGSGIRDPYLEILKVRKPDIIALPEYYFVYQVEDDVIPSVSRHDEIINTMKKWSVNLDCAMVGGSVVAESRHKLYNRSYFIADGEVVGYYDKIHPYKKEGRGLIERGSEYKVFNYNGLKIGILICADVLIPGSYTNISGLRPELIFIPTTSPYRVNEPPAVKFSRDEKLFVNGARITGAIIFKVCASGRIGDKRFQARTLIAGPAGILWRNPPEHEDKSALIYAEVHDSKNNPHLDIEVFRS